MKNKKRTFAIGFGLLSTLSAVVLSIAALPKNGFMGLFADNSELFNLTLNAQNGPTSHTATSSFEYAVNSKVTLSYVNARYQEGSHVILSEGGAITKTLPSYGLTSISATFSGDLNVIFDYSAISEQTPYMIHMESGTQYQIEGNYFKIVANKEAAIQTLSLDYGCTATSQEIKPSYGETSVTVSNVDLKDSDGRARLYVYGTCDGEPSELAGSLYHTGGDHLLEVIETSGSGSNADILSASSGANRTKSLNSLSARLEKVRSFEYAVSYDVTDVFSALEENKEIDVKFNGSAIQLNNFAEKTLNLTSRLSYKVSTHANSNSLYIQQTSSYNQTYTITSADIVDDGKINVKGTYVEDLLEVEVSPRVLLHGLFPAYAGCWPLNTPLAYSSYEKTVNVSSKTWDLVIDASTILKNNSNKCYAITIGNANARFINANQELEEVSDVAGITLTDNYKAFMLGTITNFTMAPGVDPSWFNGNTIVVTYQDNSVSNLSVDYVLDTATGVFDEETDRVVITGQVKSVTVNSGNTKHGGDYLTDVVDNLQKPYLDMQSTEGVWPTKVICDANGTVTGDMSDLDLKFVVDLGKKTFEYSFNAQSISNVYNKQLVFFHLFAADGNLSFGGDEKCEKEYISAGKWSDFGTQEAWQNNLLVVRTNFATSISFGSTVDASVSSEGIITFVGTYTADGYPKDSDIKPYIDIQRFNGDWVKYYTYSKGEGNTTQLEKFTQTINRNTNEWTISIDMVYFYNNQGNGRSSEAFFFHVLPGIYSTDGNFNCPSGVAGELPNSDVTIQYGKGADLRSDWWGTWAQDLLTFRTK